MTQSNHERVDILGVRVSAINMAQAIEMIDAWLETKTQNYACFTPAHSIIDAANSPELTDIFNNSGVTAPDGMFIVWLLKLYGRKHVSRVYGPDMLLEVCRHSKKTGYRHFFYGGAPGIPEMLAGKLTKRFPELKVVGMHSPPFRPLTDEEDQEEIEMINRSGADIVWVGIGSPKQDQWMTDHIGKIKAPVLIGIGAAFDFHSGNKKQAPPWMQRSGLEWFFRLMTEPRRLWRRYAQYPWFIVKVFAQFIGLKKY